MNKDWGFNFLFQQVGQLVEMSIVLIDFRNVKEILCDFYHIRHILRVLCNIIQHRLHVWTPPWPPRNRPSIKQIKPIFYTLPIWKFWAIVAVWAHPAVPPADTGTMHREYNNATTSIGHGETVGEERAGILILLSKCWSWKCSFHRYWNFSPPL